MKKVVTDTRVPIKIWTDDVEEAALNQIRNLANLPFINKHLAIMPDVHLGKGTSIGTVIADAFKNLQILRHSIERSIPTGKQDNRNISDRVDGFFKQINEKISAPIKATSRELKNARRQMGSLGGGRFDCPDTKCRSTKRMLFLR